MEGRLSMFGFTRRLALGLALAVTAFSAATAAPAGPGPGDMTLGDPKAKVTVIEYASFSCPHCAHFNNEVFGPFKAKYVDSGKVFYVYREFLTDPVQVAAAGALIARCAPKAKYFDVADALFKGQEAMYKSGQAGDLFRAAGKVGGLDEAGLKACLDNEATAKALETRVQTYIDRDKINATPTFVINGKPYVGLSSLDAISKLVDPLLGRRSRAK
jgi:protein-disulfide isomerase